MVRLEFKRSVYIMYNLKKYGPFTKIYPYFDRRHRFSKIIPYCPIFPTPSEKLIPTENIFGER